ncbi:cilia- and flagella-associated protein 58-like [Ctenocephalides felis]|uniref:cilia- and flagella-associated protein 58-like n=1 Tax=Ctenocephalides felis TaxID=7515 RepID=UPI000E6E184A|nr:cilia- and flagella-associated protein 58-like [Ctenocephalides felis]
MSREKQREALIRERERLQMEVAEMRRRLETSRVYQTELERKNSAADNKVLNLEQQIETQNNEALKEQRLKDRLQSQLESLTEELDLKVEEIKELTSQMDQQRMTIERIEAQKDDLIRDVEKRKHEFANLNLAHTRTLLELDQNINLVAKLNKKMSTLNLEMRLRDDEVSKLRIEIAKTEKMRESYVKKLSLAENVRFGLNKELERLKLTIAGLTRDLDGAGKAAIHEKKNLETALRERDIARRELTKQEERGVELQLQLQSQESFRRQFESELLLKAQELSFMRSQKTKVERERDKLAVEAKEALEKLSDIQDEMKEKQVALLEYKEKLAETDIRAMRIQQSFELVRSERNLLQRNLQSSTEEGVELRERVKMTLYQVEQLKEDVTGKEAKILRQEKMLSKCEKDKQQLRVDLQSSFVSLQHSKNEIRDMKALEKSLRDSITDFEHERTELRKDLVKLQNERDILGTQLVRRNDELAILYNKIAALQSSLTRGEEQYEQRIDDIKVLKLEVQKLRQEKELLTKNIDNQTDLKQEIIHLQRDLTKEKLKVTALEEEVQTPLNLHRWRKLQGSDPDKMQLIERIHILQRRLLSQGAAVEKKKSELKESELLYINLKQRALTIRGSQLKAVCAELNARNDADKGRGDAEEEIRGELRQIKVLYLEQRKVNENLKERLNVAEAKIKEIEKDPNEDDLARPPGLKMTGGGFKLSS